MRPLPQTTLVRLADTAVITSTVEVGSVLMTSLPATSDPQRIVFGSPVGTTYYRAPGTCKTVGARIWHM